MYSPGLDFTVPEQRKKEKQKTKLIDYAYVFIPLIVEIKSRFKRDNL